MDGPSPSGRAPLRLTLLLLLIAPCLSAAPMIRSKTFESVSPNGKVRVLSRCDGERRACEVTAHAGSSVVEVGPHGYPNGPGIRWVNLDTAAVEFKCGEGCRTTWFYNPRLGRSAGYRDVLAVDGVRLRVAVRSAKGADIEVLPIRVEEGAAPTCRIHRDWAPDEVAAFATRIGAAVFDSRGNLKLRYARASVRGEVSETVAIDRAGAC